MLFFGIVKEISLEILASWLILTVLGNNVIQNGENYVKSREGGKYVDDEWLSDSSVYRTINTESLYKKLFRKTTEFPKTLWARHYLCGSVLTK